MSIEWMDDFTIYGDDSTGKTNMLDGAYAGSGGTFGGPVADPDPNAPATSRAFKSTTSSVENFRKVLSATATTAGVSLRLWPDGLPGTEGSAARPIEFANAANDTLCYLLLMTTGGLKVINGAGTVIAQTTGPIIVSAAWQHIEMKVFFHASTGTAQVRVDGVTVINATGLNTLGAFSGPCAQIRNGNSSGGTQTFYVKDYIIWNTSGSTNNDFLGTVSVVALTTSSDVSLNWTPSTGTTGWDLVDETPPNDDTDYISASDALPAAAVFGVTNLDADVVAVRGLMTLIRARKTDSGDGNLQVGLVSGASTDEGANRPITSAYTYWSDISELDPATAAPWTPAGVNAVNLKLNRTV